MKVLVFCQYYYPESVGPMLMCEKMVANGDKVTVVTGLPDYNTGKVDKNYKYFKNRKEIINGVNIIRVSEIGRRKGKIWLSLNYLSYMISASFKALFMKSRYDIVYCYQLSPVTMAIPAIIFSKIKKKKCLLYSLDLWPESVKVMGITENSFVFKILNKVSKKIYNCVDKIIVSSKSFVDYFERVHGIKKEEIKYIPQASVDYSDFQSSENLEEKLSDDIVEFVFAGNCGFAQNIEMILEAVEILRKKYPKLQCYKVNIAGTGANLENLKYMAINKKISDFVQFHGFLEKFELMNLYSRADATIVTLFSNSSIGETLPLKLISYMSVGKPIIASISGESESVILDNNLGFVVKPNDSQGLSKVMYDFIQNKDKYAECGKNARRYYEKEHTIDVFVSKFNKCREEILEVI